MMSGSVLRPFVVVSPSPLSLFLPFPPCFTDFALSFFRQIWDLESKVVVDELRPEFPEVSAKAIVPYCTCLCWSNNGSILYSG